VRDAPVDLATWADDFFDPGELRLALPEDDLILCISFRRFSISLTALLRSAVNSDASLLKTLASSCSAFFVRFGVVGMD